MYFLAKILDHLAKSVPLEIVKQCQATSMIVLVLWEEVSHVIICDISNNIEEDRLTKSPGWYKMDGSI